MLSINVHKTNFIEIIRTSKRGKLPYLMKLDIKTWYFDAESSQNIKNISSVFPHVLTVDSVVVLTNFSSMKSDFIN